MAKVTYNITLKPLKEEALCIRNNGCEVAINLHPSQTWYGRDVGNGFYELCHKKKGVWLLIDKLGMEEFFTIVVTKE